MQLTLAFSNEIDLEDRGRLLTDVVCRAWLFSIWKKYIYEAGWCVDVYISYVNYFIIEGLMKREDTYIRFAALWIDNVFLSRSYFNGKEFGILTDTLFVFKDLITFSR